MQEPELGPWSLLQGSSFFSSLLKDEPQMIARDPSHRAPSVVSSPTFSPLATQDTFGEPSYPPHVPLRKKEGLARQNAPRVPQP